MPDPRRNPDEALVTLSRDRWKPLVGYAYLLTGNHQEAEDLVQEAFVRTFARRRAVDPGAIEGYVRQAILTIFVDGYRRRERWRKRVHLLATPETQDGPDAVSGEGVEVRAALADLPPQQRACVVLRYYDDLPVQEVAERLGIGLGTAKRYLSMARERLERRLGPVAPLLAETAAVLTEGDRS